MKQDDESVDSYGLYFKKRLLAVDSHSRGLLGLILDREEYKKNYPDLYAAGMLPGGSCLRIT